MDLMDKTMIAFMIIATVALIAVMKADSDRHIEKLERRIEFLEGRPDDPDH